MLHAFMHVSNLSFGDCIAFCQRLKGYYNHGMNSNGESHNQNFNDENLKSWYMSDFA